MSLQSCIHGLQSFAGELFPGLLPMQTPAFSVVAYGSYVGFLVVQSWVLVFVEYFCYSKTDSWLAARPLDFR